MDGGTHAPHHPLSLRPSIVTADFPRRAGGVHEANKKIIRAYDQRQPTRTLAPSGTKSRSTKTAGKEKHNPLLLTAMVGSLHCDGGVECLRMVLPSFSPLLALPPRPRHISRTPPHDHEHPLLANTVFHLGYNLFRITRYAHTHTRTPARICGTHQRSTALNCVLV